MSDPWLEGAPDTASMIAAVRVRMCMGNAGTPPEAFLKRADGLSQHQADAIVKACHPPTGWRAWVARLRGYLA
jgi:hypothetical protein